MLARLKEYKELITIILFFLGGLYWIEGRYAHTDQLKSVKAQFDTVAKEKSLNVLACKVDKYMRLTQLQVEAADTKERIARLDKDIAEFHQTVENLELASIDVSPAMRAGNELVEGERDHEVARLREVQASVRDLTDELERQVCSEGA